MDAYVLWTAITLGGLGVFTLLACAVSEYRRRRGWYRPSDRDINALLDEEVRGW